MQKKNIFFSIIIPVRTTTPYLLETKEKLKRQTYKNFELLVITDKVSKRSDPSYKRNLGATMAKGTYLAFLDDDSYPHKNWLKNAYKIIQKHPNYTAICGPSITPKNDNFLQKASGLLWSSFLGSGGAGTYRNYPQKARFVVDYPTVNLIVKKSDFDKIGGFNGHYWPGEDTILCLDITEKLNKKIYYHPSIRVYHHRREVLIPHLQQITRYAQHRGLFARKFPKTSLLPGYLAPSVFLIYLVFLPLLYFKINKLLIVPLLTYFLLMTLNFLLLLKKNGFLLSLVSTLTIPITHIYYGHLFIKGFLSPDINFKPHKINKKNKTYIGG